MGKVVIDRLAFISVIGSLFLMLSTFGEACADENALSVASVVFEYSRGLQDETSYNLALSRISAPEKKVEFLAVADEILSREASKPAVRMLVAEALSAHGEYVRAQKEFDGILQDSELSFLDAIRYIDICYRSTLTCEQFGAVRNDAEQRAALGFKHTEILWKEYCVGLSFETVGMVNWRGLQEANEKDHALMLEAVWLHLASSFASLVEEFRERPGIESAREMAITGHLLECVDFEIHRRPTRFFESESYRAFRDVFSDEIFSAFQTVVFWAHEPKGKEVE